MGRPTPRVAHRCRATIAALAGDTGRTADPDDMLWGRSDPKLLLYDDALLDGWRRPEWVEVSGFPYRDLRVEPGEMTHTPGADGDGQRVLVTFGSYLGPLVVDDLHQVVTALAIRAHEGTKDVTEVVVAGPRPSTWPDDSTAPSRAPPVRFVGFVPLSEILDGCTAVVHHGGIGSMFATLHHGLPALVVPQAFDQPFNARAIAARAAGRNGCADGITAGLDAVLAGDGARQAAQGVARQLVPASVAATRAVDTICRVLERTDR